MKTLKQHSSEVRQISALIKQFSKSPQSKKLRFFHGGTNSTRIQDKKNYQLIDISHLSEVIEVNPLQKYAIVEPNVSMDKLVDITLKYNLIPPVVAEFPGITCGGAINGASLESSSFKFGQFNDNCQEYEIVLGNGAIIKASKKENKDIFYGISGAYGSLGLISLIKIELITATKYVQTKYYPKRSVRQTIQLIKKLLQDKEIDYIEGIIYDSVSSVVITGKLVNSGNAALRTYSKASDPWFYQKGKVISKQDKIYEERIPLKDYLFRYNRGAFWMGEYLLSLFHIKSNSLSKYLLTPFLNTRKLYDILHAVNSTQKYFIQDIYCPFQKSLELVKFNEKNLKIYPLWLCPVKATKQPQKLSPHYLNEDILLDIGIWGQTGHYLSNPLARNKELEEFTKHNYSRKMLYAENYYSEAEFWSIYDNKWYELLRAKYDAESVFPDIWEKVHVSKRHKPQYIKGSIKVLLETIIGKNFNA